MSVEAQTTAQVAERAGVKDVKRVRRLLRRAEKKGWFVKFAATYAVRAAGEAVQSKGKGPYGATVGKDTAKINAALSPEHKTAKQIAEETKVPEGRVEDHLEYWLRETRGLGNYLVATPERWTLAEAWR